MALSHFKCERYFQSVLDGEEVILELSNEEKDKFYNVIYELPLTYTKPESLDSMVKFLRNNFTSNEQMDIIMNLIDKYYILGDVFHGFNVDNTNIVKLYCQFSDILPIVDCVVINRMNPEHVVGVFAGYAESIEKGEYDFECDDVSTEIIAYCQSENLKYICIGDITVVIFNTDIDVANFQELYNIDNFKKVPKYLLNIA